MKKMGSDICKHYDEVHAVLMSVKRSNCESGMLRTLTDLKVRAVKSCKWTAMQSSMSRFVKLFDSLSAMSEDDESKVNIDTSLANKKKSIKHSKQLNAMSQVHGRLQTHGQPRNVAQKLVDQLHGTIREHKYNSNHGKVNCMMCTYMLPCVSFANNLHNVFHYSIN